MDETDIPDALAILFFNLMRSLRERFGEGDCTFSLTVGYKIKGEKIPWHNHKNEDEFFYVIEGSLLFEIDVILSVRGV